MSELPPVRDPSPRLFGALIMAIGGLIVTLCGLCSVAWVYLSLANGIGGGVGSIFAVLAATAVVGGVPVLVGVLIFRAGLRRYRTGAKV